MDRYMITHSLLSSWLYSMKDNPYEDIETAPEDPLADFMKVLRRERTEPTDAMLNGIAANLDALHKLNEAIPDPQLSRAMDRMEKAGRSIAAVVEKTPDKARSVDRFARYYLPEVVKLMGTYAALEQNGVRGENAAQIEAELRRNAETTATAFENQLDALYSAEAMDISTDIEVLDSILKSQNLAK